MASLPIPYYRGEPLYYNKGLIGQGVFAMVYEMVELKTGKVYAGKVLKVEKPDSDVLDKFTAHQKLLQSLKRICSMFFFSPASVSATPVDQSPPFFSFSFLLSFFPFFSPLPSNTP